MEKQANNVKLNTLQSSDQRKKRNKNRLLGVGLLLLAALLFSFKTSAQVLHPNDIKAIRITKTTYNMDTKPMFTANYDTTYIDDQAEIDAFVALWEGDAFMLLPSCKAHSGYGVDAATVNYYVELLYEEETSMIHFFDTYGTPIVIDGRKVWFTMFRTSNDLYQAIASFLED